MNHESICLLQIWAAVLTLDLQQRRAVRSGAPLLQNADLKTLLADPFVMHIAGATCELHPLVSLAPLLAWF